MRIAIVGAGIGGLVTALMLRKQGIEVDVYESKAVIGGRLAFEQGMEYRIDQGPTIVLLPEMLLSLLEEAGISRDSIPLMACEPLYRIHYKDGTVFHKYRDQAKQITELDKWFPGESEGFKRYMVDMQQSFVEGKQAFLERPFLRKKDFFSKQNIKLLAKLSAHRSAQSMAARYFKDERLIDAFSLQTLYIGGAPFNSPALYTLLPYAEHAFGIWYVKGGYASILEVITAALKEHSINLYLEAPVERLITEGEVCTGIVVNGETKSYDAVVYNGDFPQINPLLSSVQEAAKGSMLSVSNRKARTVKRALSKTSSYKPSSGCVLIYLGLDRQWSEASTHQFFLPASLTAGLKQIFEEQRIPDDPSFYIFYPSAIDPDAAPPGQSVMYMLIPSPPATGKVDWEVETTKLVERVLEEAEQRGFPGLRKAIRWKSIRTPEQALGDGLYQGGSFGIAPILSQSALYRPQIAPFPIERLYAVGASIHPGGGVPIVLQGARILSQHLSKEMTKWKSSTV